MVETMFASVELETDGKGYKGTLLSDINVL
jgi:hypothetical protein